MQPRRTYKNLASVRRGRERHDHSLKANQPKPMTPKEDARLNEMNLSSLLALVESGNLPVAISSVKANPDPVEASATFIELARQTYRQLKDVSSMVAIADAGTQFALSQGGPSVDVGKLRRNAKVLAFNTAANCWPGWGDEGVEIRTEHLEAGLKLATLFRDLTEELDLGHKERGTAHWLIGALHLAMGEFAESIAALQRAKDEYRAGGNSDQLLMAEGYAALALKAQPASRSAGALELDRILRQLGNQNSKE